MDKTHKYIRFALASACVQVHREREPSADRKPRLAAERGGAAPGTRLLLRGAARTPNPVLAPCPADPSLPPRKRTAAEDSGGVGLRAPVHPGVPPARPPRAHPHPSAASRPGPEQVHPPAAPAPPSRAAPTRAPTLPSGPQRRPPPAAPSRSRCSPAALRPRLHKLVRGHLGRSLPAARAGVPAGVPAGRPGDSTHPASAAGWGVRSGGHAPAPGR